MRFRIGHLIVTSTNWVDIVPRVMVDRRHATDRREMWPWSDVATTDLGHSTPLARGHGFETPRSWGSAVLRLLVSRRGAAIFLVSSSCRISEYFFQYFSAPGGTRIALSPPEIVCYNCIVAVPKTTCLRNGASPRRLTCLIYKSTTDPQTTPSPDDSSRICYDCGRPPNRVAERPA